MSFSGFLPQEKLIKQGLNKVAVNVLSALSFTSRIVSLTVNTVLSPIFFAADFAVKLSLHDGYSFAEIPGNGGRYDIQLGQNVILFCNVTSITRPQRSWNKQTYQGYEAVQSREFQAEFSSSGFGWSSSVHIPQFNYTDSGNYSCSGTVGSNHGIGYATLYVEGK